jgi:hypothetical protein
MQDERVEVLSLLCLYHRFIPIDHVNEGDCVDRSGREVEAEMRAELRPAD